MKKVKWYLSISGGLIPITYLVITLGSKFLSQTIICAIVAVLYLVYNLVYVKGILIHGRYSSKDVSLSGLVLFFVFIALINYALIYYGFYQVNPGNFLVSTDEKCLNLCDFFYFSVATLATVGYGDIVVITTPLKFIAATEIINGIVLLIFGLQSLKLLNRTFTGN